jgi:hypothetical protein
MRRRIAERCELFLRTERQRSSLHQEEGDQSVHSKKAEALAVDPAAVPDPTTRACRV